MSNVVGQYDSAPAIKQPSITPYLIRGPNAERFLEDFNRVVDAQYRGNKNLKVLALRDVEGVPTVVGSNPLILPIVHSLVSPARRVGLPEDLQRTLNDGDTLGIRGNHYVDLGVVLDFTGRNHDMAVDFYEQLPKGLRNLDLHPSVVVGYGLKNSDNGKLGLGLVHAEGTQVRPARILANGDWNFSDADVPLDTGLPSKLSGGNRKLWTTTQKAHSVDNLGLSRLCLDWYLYLNSDDEDLADSVDIGRVVLF